MKFVTFSYRFADEVLRSKRKIKKEIEDVIKSIRIGPKGISRPDLNKKFTKEFKKRKWKVEPQVFPEPKDPSAKIDFLKDRVGIEVAFGHSSFIGIDLLKLQTLSYSGLDRIDVGVYIMVTRELQKKLIQKYRQTWEGSLTFEKVKKYLPHFRSAIQVPILVIGLKE